MKYLKCMKLVVLLCMYKLSFPCLAIDVLTINATHNERDLYTYRYTLGDCVYISSNISSMFDGEVPDNSIPGTITNNTNNINNECRIELNSAKLRWQKPLNSSARFMLSIACSTNVDCIISKLKALFDDRSDHILCDNPKKSNSVFTSTDLVEFEVWEFPLQFHSSGEMNIAISGCGFIPMASHWQWKASELNAEKDSPEVTLSFLKEQHNFKKNQDPNTINLLQRDTNSISSPAKSRILSDYFFHDFLRPRNEINTVCPATHKKKTRKRKKKPYNLNPPSHSLENRDLSKTAEALRNPSDSQVGESLKSIRCRENHYIKLLFERNDNIEWSASHLVGLSVLVNIYNIPPSVLHISDEMMRSFVIHRKHDTKWIGAEMLQEFKNEKGGHEIINLLLESEHSGNCLVNWQNVAIILLPDEDLSKYTSLHSPHSNYTSNNAPMDEFFTKHPNIANAKVNDNVCQIISRTLENHNELANKIGLKPINKNYTYSHFEVESDTKYAELEFLISLMNKSNSDNVALFCTKLMHYPEHIHVEQLKNALLCLETKTIDQVRINKRQENSPFYMELRYKKSILEDDIQYLQDKLDISEHYTFFNISHMFFKHEIDSSMSVSDITTNLFADFKFYYSPSFPGRLLTTLLKAERNGLTIDWGTTCFPQRPPAKTILKRACNIL